MNWNPQLQLELEFSPSRVAIILLLILFFIFAVPLVRERNILCIEGTDGISGVIRTIWTNPPMKRNPEYGENCYSRDSRITILSSLKKGFYHKYSHTDSETDEKRTHTTFVMKQDFLWLFLVIPLAYFVSAPIKGATIDTWRSGSRVGLLNLVLVGATLLPGFIASGFDPNVLMWSPAIVYAFPPLLLLFSFASPTFLDLIILVILLISAVMVVRVLPKVLVTRKSIIYGYTLWIVYLVAVYLGICFLLFF